jgi:glycerol-3-phosphate dehydrogenase (NAD(P)+)
MNSITIVGAGAWGTALAIHAARTGATVTLVARDVSRVSRRLPGFSLPPQITLTTEPPITADAILIAVPAQHLRATVAQLPPNSPLLVCCKGIESGTGRLPLEIVGQILPRRAAAILTGPNFAAEIAAGLPAASVIAAEDAGLRAHLIALLATNRFRLYGNDDPVGAQLGGAAKNVIAIAAGILTGAGYGENARAALITRGLAELSRLIVAMGGRAETASGLSGLGDLVLTCTGPASRNFAHGVALGRGERPHRDDGPVVEGIATAPALMARATGIDLPICAAVADVLESNVTVAEALDRVMARPLREEFKEGVLF